MYIFFILIFDNIVIVTFINTLFLNKNIDLIHDYLGYRGITYD